jgi:hypothetical protein
MTDAILELVEIAVGLAESQFSGKDLAHTLLDIVQRGADAYEENTGKSLNVGLVEAEDAL